MAKKIDWTRVGRAAIVGIIFFLIAVILSGDMSSVPVALLAAYLEYKMK